MIAYAVRYRVNRDTLRGKEDRACIEVFDTIKVAYPEIKSYETVKGIYKKHLK